MIKFDFFVEFIDYLSFGFCNVLQTLWVIIIIIVVVFYFVSRAINLKLSWANVNRWTKGYLDANTLSKSIF